MNRPDGITFILPAKNEGPHIFKTLSELYAAIGACGYSFEMLCIDDGSDDDTLQGIERFAQGKPEVEVIRFETNQGLGYSCREGYRRARFAYAMFVPTNGMLDPTSMFHKLKERNPSEVVVFEVANSDIRPTARKALSKTYNYLMTRFFNIDVRYVHAMLLLPMSVVRVEDMHADRSFHVVEVLVLALRKWNLQPVVQTNRLKRGTGVERSKSFVFNNVKEIGYQALYLRSRI